MIEHNIIEYFNKLEHNGVQLVKSLAEECARVFQWLFRVYQQINFKNK